MASSQNSSSMPRHGNNPTNEPSESSGTVQHGRGHICKACSKFLKNKSGYTQHVNLCPVLLQRRLWRPEATPRGRDRDDGNDEGPPGFLMDPLPAPDDDAMDHDGGEWPGREDAGQMDMEEQENTQRGAGDDDTSRSRRTHREYHTGLTGALAMLLAFRRRYSYKRLRSSPLR